MRVTDFLDIVAEYLQEDFSTSPVWTKAQLLDYTRQIYRTFCNLTGLVDRIETRLINSTTGEVDVPKDFDHLWFLQHEKRHIDIVDLDELDFASSTWAAGTTGTADAGSIIGSGDNAVVRLAPVPTSVWDGGSSHTLTKTSLYVQYNVTYRYLIRTTSGVITTTPAGPGSSVSPVIAGPTTYWTLGITIGGELTTTQVGSGSPSYYGLTDTNDSNIYWELSCSDDGELITSPEYLSQGLGIAALVDYNNYMDFTGYGGGGDEYGIITDIYGTGTTTPDYVARANMSRGLTLFANTSDETATLWYKGALPELKNLYSELLLGDAFVPVLLHGVLSLAYAATGDGQDRDKANLMTNVFVAECNAIKRSFQYRWA